MENTIKKRPMEKLKGLCGRLCGMRVRADYSFSASVYDKRNGMTPECEHTVKGSSDHSIIKLVLFCGAIAVTASAVSMLRGLSGER